MKTIFGVTSHYMPLIANEDLANPSLRAMYNRRIIHTQDITKEIIEDTFFKSKKRILAFNTKEEAYTAMALGLRGNNTNPDFIDGNIPFFAVPLIFTLEVEDDYDLQAGENLTGSMIYNYFDTDSIPYYSSDLEQGFWKDSIIRGLDKKIHKLDVVPKVFSIEKEAVVNKVDVSYLATNPVRDANVNLNNPMQDLNNIRSQENPPAEAMKCVLF